MRRGGLAPRDRDARAAGVGRGGRRGGPCCGDETFGRSHTREWERRATSPRARRANQRDATKRWKRQPVLFKRRTREEQARHEARQARRAAAWRGVSETAPLGAGASPTAHDNPAHAMGWSRLLGDEVLTKDGRVATQSLLADKERVLLYFSASWCPPCRAYTPELSAAYAECDASKCAVIFVSLDRSDADFEAYWDKMSFHALPWNVAHATELKEGYGVQGIPALVVLSGDGSVLCTNARGQHAAYLK